MYLTDRLIVKLNAVNRNGVYYSATKKNVFDWRIA